MTVFEAFCEEYETEYLEWLAEKEFEDTDEAKEVFAYSYTNGLAFSNFEYNYADEFNDSRLAAGE